MRTVRLVMRQWLPSDREPFAALNADPEVMRHFPAGMTRAESDVFADRLAEALDRDGCGLWALEVVLSGEFIGFTGIQVPSFAAHFMPAVEVGWRLARGAWGCGYATEAARAAVDFAFTRLDLAGLVSFTVPANVRSQAVMRRLGMTHDPADDFDHPRLPDGHPLRRHVLYRLARPAHPGRAG
jgi:RimJ/RimL family protein N-acetyltransferase